MKVQLAVKSILPVSASNFMAPPFWRMEVSQKHFVQFLRGLVVEPLLITRTRI